MAHVLEKEKKIFEKNFDEWKVPHLGKFVLIKGADTVGFFSTLDAAFKAGTTKFGLDPFFIEQIFPIPAVNVTFLGNDISTDK